MRKQKELLEYVMPAAKWLARRFHKDTEDDFTCRKYAIWIVIAGATILLGIAASCQSRAPSILREQCMLLRPKPGEGSQEVELRVGIGETEYKGQPLRVRERAYTEQEWKVKLAQLQEKLESLILGQNRDLKHVSKPLNLVSKYEGISLIWECAPALVNTDGVIQKEVLETETRVVLTAEVHYKDFREEISIPLILLPPDRSEEEQLLRRWKQKLEESDSKSASASQWNLPREVSGKRVYYQESTQTGFSGYIWIIGFLAIVGTPVLLRKEEQRKAKKREEQLLRDYPDFVSRFVLLVGAGMTSLAAIGRMVTQFREQNSTSRYLYQELQTSMNQVQNGKPEREVYEQLGRRLQLVPYLRFTTLLAQNMKKGNERLLTLLSLEVVESQKTRQQVAKERGEEAGSKLLLPIGIMFVLVLSIILYAAFAQM